MRVGVIGAGYVGLTTSACFAHLGHDVVCADLDAERVGRLNKGEVPILEERLPDLVAEGLRSRRLRFVVGAPEAARGAEVVFLCVNTPQGADGAADLTYVERAVREIAHVLAAGAVVVNKSTVPVRSTRAVQRWLDEEGVGAADVRVASNPEFLREGRAVRDFLNPDRIVIGSDDPAAAVRVSDLYKGLRAAVLVTDPESAEMIKYASNALLATRIAFINSIANLCEAFDADVREVALGMGYDPRIGFEFLHPGPGFGGSCFPKDTSALLHMAESAGVEFEILDAVRNANRVQHARVVDKVRDAAGGSLEGSTVAIWGLTFKAETDDLRDSPAMEIARRLVEEGATVRGYDPAAGEAAAQRCPGLEVCPDPYAACEGAHVLAVLTEWDEFRWLDFDRVRDAMAAASVVDGRNLLDPQAMRRRRFTYTGIGR